MKVWRNDRNLYCQLFLSFSTNVSKNDLGGLDKVAVTPLHSLSQVKIT